MDGRGIGWTRGLFFIVYACLFLPTQEISSGPGQNYAPRPKIHVGEADSSSSSQHLRRNRKNAEAWLNEATQDSQGSAAKSVQSSLRDSATLDQARQGSQDGIEDQTLRQTPSINHSYPGRTAAAGRDADENIHAMRYVIDQPWPLAGRHGQFLRELHESLV